MELAHSLLLNETALLKLPNDKRPVFIYEWLRFLDKVLPVANKTDIKEKQEHILKILLNQLEKSPGPPTRKLLGKNLATLFKVGDSYSLHLTLNMCNDFIRNKDDNPSYLATKLAAITALGEIYSKLGRMVGRSYEETISLLVKSMKQAESQCRSQIMLTLQHVVRGLGSVAVNSHKDILRVTKTCLLDRSMPVRSSACKCFLALIENSPTLQTVDVDSTVSLCFKTLEQSNYEVRCEMANVLGFLLSKTQQSQQNINTSTKNTKIITLDDVFSMFQQGFIKSANTLFKSANVDVGRGNGQIIREVRVGVTHAIIKFATYMGIDWLERHLSLFITKVLSLVSIPKAAPNHVEAVNARRCVNFILRSVVRLLLSQGGQIQSGRELCGIIRHTIAGLPAKSNEFEYDNIGTGSSGVSSTGGTGSGSGGSGGSFLSRNSGNNDCSQHVLICILQELSCLIQILNNGATVLLESQAGLLESVFPVLIYPSVGAQLSAAFCLRCIAEAIPGQRIHLLDRCLQKLSVYDGNPDAVLGFSYGIGALFASVDLDSVATNQTALFEKAQVVFNKAEDMLKSGIHYQQQQSSGATISGTNARLLSAKVQSAWFLIGACCSLGNTDPSFIKSLLPKLLHLWRNAFPRNTADIEGEKQRGDSFTWQISIESRSGALSSIHSFLEKSGPELMTDEVLRRILPIIEFTLSIVSLLPTMYRNHGSHLKSSAAMLRLRLYNLLLILPVNCYSILFDKPKGEKRKGTYNTLLRELVAEFTLSDNATNTTTSLLRSMCHLDDSVILGSWLQETDNKQIEDQLQPNSASGSGALEHDNMTLILFDTDICKTKGIVSYPSPLPLGVAVIDSSVQLFGRLFPIIQSRHRLQILEHFWECVRQQQQPGSQSAMVVQLNSSSHSTRQQAVQINIFTAVLCAMRRLADTKTAFGSDHKLRKEAANLIFGSLLSPNPILRCAAGECLGRMAQVIGEANFVAETAQYSFDRLKTDRDVVSRTGYSLALGCLHRYVGGLGSGQHLSKSVGILLALVQDMSSPTVQVWALHALALIADSGGPMFRRDYLELTMSLVLNLLLQTPPAHTEVYQCLGKLLGALITSLGPELDQGGGSSGLLDMTAACSISCSLLQDHPDSLVQAEAVSCLQQLHMFASKQINLSSIIRHLYAGLSSCHLLLRRAVVACLRQLSQKESCFELTRMLSVMMEEELSTGGSPTNSSNMSSIHNNNTSRHHFQHQTNSDVLKAAFLSHGLIGCLFQMLDLEQDIQLRSDLEDTILCILQSGGESELSRWLSLLREVIQAGRVDRNTPAGGGGGGGGVGGGLGEGGRAGAAVTSKSGGENIVSHDDDDLHDDGAINDDDDVKFSANKDEGVIKAFKGCRWPTKVFAAECFRKIFQMCKDSKNKERHLNLTLARNCKLKSGCSNSLILQLSDLISFSFIAATQEIDRLRLVGLSALQDIITLFANIPEPEYPDQSILEQYQAQVGAALRPAFAVGTSGEVTARACDVCSSWVASGVAATDHLRRVQQLLADCLQAAVIGEGGAATVASADGLAVLSAWAEIYLLYSSSSSSSNTSSGSGGGHQHQQSSSSELVVDPNKLAGLWWRTLHDYAVISLPATSPFNLTTEDKSGSTSLPYSIVGSSVISCHYPKRWPVILLAATHHLVVSCARSNNNNDSSNIQTDNDKVFLIIGLCVDAICGFVSKQSDSTIGYCLRACVTLLSCEPMMHTVVFSPISPSSNKNLNSGNKQPNLEQQGTLSNQLNTNTTELSSQFNFPVAAELLKVVHRLMLTRDAPDLHLQALTIVRLLVSAIDQYSKDAANGNNSATFSLIESVATFIQSPIFTSLEIVVCGLTRYVPLLLEKDVSRQLYGAEDNQQGPMVSLPLVVNSEPIKSLKVVTELLSLLPLIYRTILFSASSQIHIISLPTILHICVSVCNLEIFRRSEKEDEETSYKTSQTPPQLYQSPLPQQTPHQRCSNDTSPWKSKVQEQLADQIIAVYTELICLCQQEEAVVTKQTLIANSLLSLLAQSNSVEVVYLISRILKSSSGSISHIIGGGGEGDICSVLIDKCHILWQRHFFLKKNQNSQQQQQQQQQQLGYREVAISVECVALLQSFNYLIAVPDIPAMKLFVRNLSDLIINWMFKLPSQLHQLPSTAGDAASGDVFTNIQITLLLRQFSLAIDFIEALLEATDSDKTSVIISTLIPVLILFLIPQEETTTATDRQKWTLPAVALHNHSLQRINSLAPRYATAFRQCLQQPELLELKLRLEAAAKRARLLGGGVGGGDPTGSASPRMIDGSGTVATTGNTAAASSGGIVGGVVGAGASGSTANLSSELQLQKLQQQQPKIALKMDFSNFT